MTERGRRMPTGLHNVAQHRVTREPCAPSLAVTSTVKTSCSNPIKPSRRLLELCSSSRYCGWRAVRYRRRTQWTYAAGPSLLPCCAGTAYPESVGKYFHGALQREQAGQCGIHVVQDKLVSVCLVVVLGAQSEMFTTTANK